jgi:hypothetical protein
MPLLLLTALCVAPGMGRGQGSVEWLAGNGRPCEQVCRAARLRPVASGPHVPDGRQTGDRFLVCAGERNGWRPGYNLQPNWSNACWVGFGGREVAVPNYVCACH